MVYPIDKDVALPDGVGKYPDFDLTKMAVGHSFLIPYKDITPDGDPSPHDVELWRQAIYNQADKCRIKQNGFRAVTRRVAGGIRVWRLS